MVSNKSKKNAANFNANNDDVFARIAGRYDLLCDFFSLLLHRRWKSQTAKFIAAHNPQIFLDAATGTGHIALRVKARIEREKNADKKNCKIIATDISPAMLEIAKSKTNGTAPGITFKTMDVHDLKEITANSIDIVSVSLAMKICDRKKVLNAVFRVLKPGGIFVCLEASTIKYGPLSRVYLKYMDWCLPIIGRIATSGDSSAYLYLLKGIHKFPDQESFVKELNEKGFEKISYKNMTLGAVALHTCRKPI